MSLEGKLKDFGIADILQLLAQQQKTGMLFVERASESAEIYFLNGLVIETRSSQHSDRLGEMLIRGGYVNRKQIDSALSNQGDTFDHLGKILVKDGLIEHQVLQQALYTQTIETFFDILQWVNGQYSFITDKIKKEGVLENIPGVQNILLDVLRMIDEWPEIKKVIPSLAVTYELIEGHSPDDIELDELPVYQLIDGSRSVQEIVDGSLMGRYAACKILVELLQDGIIRRGSSKAAGTHEEFPSIFDRIVGTGPYVLLALLLMATLYLPTGFPASILPVVAGQKSSQSQLEDFFGSLGLQRIQYTIEAFYCRNARYPLSLSELVDAGLITPECIPGTVRYAKKRSHYELGGVEP